MLTEKLAAMAREYHQLHSQRQARGREADESAAQRRLGQKMTDLADRFERLVSHWVGDDALAEAWRRHLYDSAVRPDGHDLAEPPFFRGRTAAGARIEVRRATESGGEAFEIFSDGACIARESGPWRHEVEAIEPVTIAGQVCIDTHSASRPAMEALRAFVERPESEPPWQFARELYEDGLIDFDFALTSRGRRCLGAERPASSGPVSARLAGTRARYCVIAADAARARILLLATADSGLSPTLMPLTEVADLSGPDGRAGPSSGHAVSVHRENRRKEASREFADEVAEAAARVWRTLPDCHIVVVANPTMLGLLRPAIARRTSGPTPHSMRELSRDLSKLTPPALHDALAAAGILPARGRRQPRRLWQRGGIR